MEGFTPAFFLQVIVAIGSGGLAYGALRADLKNLMRSVDEERRIREAHEREDDQTHHDIRDAVGVLSNRLARMEGANDLSEKIVTALKRA